jgi:uncharacterized integral membrane protein
MQIGFIVILIIAIFVTIFAIQNGTPVNVDLFFVTFETYLPIVIITCIIIGAVLALIFGTTRQLKKRSESKEIKNRIKILEGDKLLADNNVKSMETEIKSLKDNNSSLSTKISELEEKNKSQAETIAKLNNELETLKAGKNLTETELDTSEFDKANGVVETGTCDEKSETQIE